MTAAEDERRAFRRAPITVRMNLRFETIGEYAQFESLDVSAGGAFVATSTPKPVGSHFILQLQLADRGFYLSGRVVRSEPSGERPGMGIEFLGVSSSAAAELAALIEAHARDGAARALRPASLRGRLEQLGLAPLIVMLEMERKEGVIEIHNAVDERVGRLYVRGGHIVSADVGELRGEDCVYEMMDWEHGSFAFDAQTVDIEQTILASPTSLLMEGARRKDELNR